jgi:hypothetical protein
MNAVDKDKMQMQAERIIQMQPLLDYNLNHKQIIVYAICWCKTWQFRNLGN